MYIARIPAPLHAPTDMNHRAPRRLSGAAFLGTSARLAAKIVAQDTE